MIKISYNTKYTNISNIELFNAKYIQIRLILKYNKLNLGLVAYETFFKVELLIKAHLKSFCI